MAGMRSQLLILEGSRQSPAPRRQTGTCRAAPRSVVERGLGLPGLGIQVAKDGLRIGRSGRAPRALGGRDRPFRPVTRLNLTHFDRCDPQAFAHDAPDGRGEVLPRAQPENTPIGRVRLCGPAYPKGVGVIQGGVGGKSENRLKTLPKVSEYHAVRNPKTV